MKIGQACLRWIGAVACVALILAVVGSAAATTIERMSLAKMAQAAPLIVRAVCVGNSVAQDAGEIWTLTSFDVEETWRGEAQSQVRVRLLGGSLGNITSHVSGVPRFRPGEDVVLFLEPTTRGDFSVVSWEQGTFRIQRGGSGGWALVTQDTASFSTFDSATRTFRVSGIRNMPLDDLHARIEAALHKAEGKQP
jgi:hypothetical protein